MSDRAAFKVGYDKIDWQPLPPADRPASTHFARSDLPCPGFISDTMPPASHVDGKYYTSKSEYRAVTKAHGYVEVGNDPARLRPPEKPKRDTKRLDAALHRAISQLG